MDKPNFSDGGSDHSLTGRRFDIGNTDEELPGVSTSNKNI